MKKSVRNKYTMGKGVQRTLNSNLVKLQKIPALLRAKSQFDDLLEDVEELDDNIKVNKGVRMEKEALREAIADEALVLSGALQVFADQEEDLQLLETVKLNKREVANGPEKDVQAILKPLLEAGEGNLAVLADYGVTRSQLRSLATKLDDFSEMLGQPRQGLIKVNVNKKLLEDVVQEMMDLLNKRIDKLMLFFKVQDEAFYEEYQRSRVIVDR